MDDSPAHAAAKFNLRTYPRLPARSYLAGIPAHTRAFPEVVPKCGRGAAPAAWGQPNPRLGRLLQTGVLPKTRARRRAGRVEEDKRRVTRPSGNMTGRPLEGLSGPRWPKA